MMKAPMMKAPMMKATPKAAPPVQEPGQGATASGFAFDSECGSRWPDLDLKIWGVGSPSPVGATRKPEG